MTEAKEYTVVGKVEIGTDEYRDLITNGLNSEKEASENRSKYWAESTKSGNLAKELEIVKKQLQDYNSFITTKNLTDSFKNFKIEQRVIEESD